MGPLQGHTGPRSTKFLEERRVKLVSQARAVLFPSPHFFALIGLNKVRVETDG